MPVTMSFRKWAPAGLEPADQAGKISDLEHDPVPPARLLPGPVGHWPRAAAGMAGRDW